METKIREKLKEKGLADSSIKLYVRQLEKLQDGSPLKTLAFLKNTDDIMQKLNDYKDNTKKLYLSAIVTTLDAIHVKKPAHFNFYQEKLNILKKEYNDKDKNVKSDAETANWVEFSEIEKMLDEWIGKCNFTKKKITASEFETLQKTFILSLYVLLPPRRNMDYLKCLIVDNLPEHQDSNFLVLDKSEFVFHKFKTAKNGSQVVSFKDNDKFVQILNLYLKYHPVKDKVKPLLVNFEGKPFVHVNSITRVLNKMFGKKIGSSMLRKIYISYKFGDQLDKIKEMNQTAKDMGHSSATAQSVYLKG